MMDSLTRIKSKDIFFSTGVNLQAFEVEINGKKQWRWVAVGFEEDTYFNGENIDINDYADSFEGLINND
jgi:hypothetical protein